MKRQTLTALLMLVLFTLFLSPPAHAHPGKTDYRGGHTDNSTGEYHYHHGYPAHDHYDMDGDGVVDCPYDFDDRTDHSSGNNGSTGSSADDRIQSGVPKGDPPHRESSLADTILVMLEYLPAAIGIWFFSSYFLFYICALIFGEGQGCSTAMIAGVVIALAAYAWIIITKLL